MRKRRTTRHWGLFFELYCIHGVSNTPLGAHRRLGDVLGCYTRGVHEKYNIIPVLRTKIRILFVFESLKDEIPLVIRILGDVRLRQ